MIPQESTLSVATTGVARSVGGQATTRTRTARSWRRRGGHLASRRSFAPGECSRADPERRILLTGLQARTERKRAGRSVAVVLRRSTIHAAVVPWPTKIDSQALGRRPAGTIASAVVTGRRRRGGVAHQLLDHGQIGTRVEEVTGIGPAQVMGGHGGQAGGQRATGEDLADGLAAERVAEAEVAPAVDGPEERSGRVARSSIQFSRSGPTVGERGTSRCLPPLPTTRRAAGSVSTSRDRTPQDQRPRDLRRRRPPRPGPGLVWPNPCQPARGVLPVPGDPPALHGSSLLTTFLRIH